MPFKAGSVTIAMLSCALVSASQPGVTLEMSIRPHVVTLREPIVLQYGVVNHGGRRILANLGYDRAGAFEFELTGPDGAKQVARPQLQFVGDSSARMDEVVVPPLGRYEQRIVLDEWLKFPAAGKYRLVVRFYGVFSQVDSEHPKMTLGDGRRPPRSSPSLPDRTFDVVVLPRDDRALEARLREIATRLQLPGATARGDAVNELTQIRDPLAVPYLEAALSANVSPRFADTLARIGTPEARRALERLTAHSTPWVAASAAAALARLK